MADVAREAGVSRQAVYLHFETRADLLIAVTHHVDDLLGVDERLAASRSARSGAERLDRFIDAWGGYIPEIYPVACALMSMAETDEAAATAWRQRMLDMREGCDAAIGMLLGEGALTARYPREEATDILWTLLSVSNWEQLTLTCGWAQERYIASMKGIARRLFVASEVG